MYLSFFVIYSKGIDKDQQQRNLRNLETTLGDFALHLNIHGYLKRLYYKFKLFGKIIPLPYLICVRMKSDALFREMIFIAYKFVKRSSSYDTKYKSIFYTVSLIISRFDMFCTCGKCEKRFNFSTRAR